MKMKFTLLIIGFLFAGVLSSCNLPQKGQSEAKATQSPKTEEPTQQPILKNDQCGNQYYPVVNGAQWSYNGPTGPFTNTISTGDNGTFTITAQSEKHTFVMQGVCIDGGDINILDVPGVSLDSSGDSGSSQMTTTSNDGITLPGDIQIGDDWSQTIGVNVVSGEQNMNFVIDSTYTAEGYESVTVPAGTFFALKINQSSNMGSGTPTEQTLWYVQGIGVVKTLIALDQPLSTELVSYNIP